MNIAGIIAEYDPFHRGHEYHMKRARELTHAGAVYVMLSGCVRQRGEMAMLNPYDRAACALECGADAVFALPVLWTVTDAEHYALGAVASLAEKGATHLVFGAERGDLASLQRLAGFLEEPTEAFDRALRTGLDAGLGYPRALSAAAESALPGGEAGKILREPNNILALCYLLHFLKEAE